MTHLQHMQNTLDKFLYSYEEGIMWAADWKWSWHTVVSFQFSLFLFKDCTVFGCIFIRTYSYVLFVDLAWNRHPVFTFHSLPQLRLQWIQIKLIHGLWSCCISPLNNSTATFLHMPSGFYYLSAWGQTKQWNMLFNRSNIFYCCLHRQLCDDEGYTSPGIQIL